jgi:hypothetical protein
MAMPGTIPPEPLRYLGAQMTMYAPDTANSQGVQPVPQIRRQARLSPVLNGQGSTALEVVHPSTGAALLR